MIEINLLPPEFRPREKTNLPLVATVACGILLVGSIILYGIYESGQLAGLKADNATFQNNERDLLARVKHVHDLQGKIKEQKARQDTIIQISQSKIMWSLKLQQLSQIMSDFPGFWIQRMTLTKSRRGSTLTLACSATGSSLREVARFRDALKDDPNFFYHFSNLISLDVNVQPLQNMNYAEKMVFSIKLPLTSVVPNRRRRRR